MVSVSFRLINAHDLPVGGYLGVNKTYIKFRDRYFWPKLYMDIQHSCLSWSPRQRLITTPPLPSTVEGPMEKLSFDIFGTFPVSRNNNRYIFVFMDISKKCSEAFAFPNIEL